ncbi:TPA_asm: hypothetical protein [Cannabis sativa amalgavirus 1]|nr:TPA_asm: hypothetical protein [Cannabis sativa amalgavirus 1]
MAANRKGKRVLEVATGVDPLKAVDWNAELGAHLEILGTHNFPVTTYNAASIRQIPMTVEKFIKTVRIFTSLDDEEMRGYMVAIGTVKGYFLETRTATCRHIVEWCEFLRSKEGQKMTRDRAFEAKLRRKAPASGDIKSTAKLSTFQQMITDHSQSMKQSRAYWEGRLKKHMMRYNRAKVRMEENFAEINAEFAPAGEFVQLSGVQYTNACIDMYKEQCVANGVAMPAMTDDLIRDCETMFGNIVRENYQEMFLRDPAKEKMLDTYLRKKIMHFNEEYDASNAETFRRYLATISGAENAQIPIVRADNVVGEHSGGEDNEEGEGEDDSETGIPPDGQQVGAEADGGDQAGTSNNQQGREGRRTRTFPLGSPALTRGRARTRVEGSSDPARQE